MATTLKNQKRHRQQFDYNQISAFKEAHQDKAGDYRNFCEEIASIVYNNSLVSAIALLKSKKDKAEYAALYSHISEWLIKEQKLLPSGDLLKTLIHMEDGDLLRLCTKEIMLLADALKEIAKAELPKKAKE